MYAVIALFDTVLEQRIKMIWEELESNKISYYAREVEDRIPHITLASYKEVSVTNFINELEIFYKDKKKIQVEFQAVGSFKNTQTLFYSPTITKELMELHYDHHQYFSLFHNQEESLYRPGKWVPHCTVANRLSKEKLKEAYNYCLNIGVMLEGQINRIGLIRVDNSKHAPVIYSKSLIEL